MILRLDDTAFGIEIGQTGSDDAMPALPAQAASEG